jgi:hypothetical protein
MPIRAYACKNQRWDIEQRWLEKQIKREEKKRHMVWLPQLFLWDLQVLEYISVLQLSHPHQCMLPQMAWNLLDAPPQPKKKNLRYHMAVI